MFGIECVQSIQYGRNYVSALRYFRKPECGVGQLIVRIPIRQTDDFGSLDRITYDFFQILFPIDSRPPLGAIPLHESPDDVRNDVEQSFFGGIGNGPVPFDDRVEVRVLAPEQFQGLGHVAYLGMVSSGS